MKSQTILIVEDSAEDFALVKRAFRKSNLGNPLRWCRDGDSALEYLRREGTYANQDGWELPGLILLDLNLPGTDGREVIVSVKKDERLKTIPIVVLTTSEDEDDIEECYGHGANSYVKKPVSIEDFFRALQSLNEYWFHIALLPRPEN